MSSSCQKIVLLGHSKAGKSSYLIALLAATAKREIYPPLYAHFRAFSSSASLSEELLRSKNEFIETGKLDPQPTEGYTERNLIVELTEKPVYNSFYSDLSQYKIVHKCELKVQDMKGQDFTDHLHKATEEELKEYMCDGLMVLIDPNEEYKYFHHYTNNLSDLINALHSRRERENETDVRPWKRVAICATKIEKYQIRNRRKAENDLLAIRKLDPKRFIRNYIGSQVFNELENLGVEVRYYLMSLYGFIRDTGQANIKRVDNNQDILLTYTDEVLVPLSERWYPYNLIEPLSYLITGYEGSTRSMLDLRNKVRSKFDRDQKLISDEMAENNREAVKYSIYFTIAILVIIIIAKGC